MQYTVLTWTEKAVNMSTKCTHTKSSHLSKHCTSMMSEKLLAKNMLSLILLFESFWRWCGVGMFLERHQSKWDWVMCFDLAAGWRRSLSGRFSSLLEFSVLLHAVCLRAKGTMNHLISLKIIYLSRRGNIILKRAFRQSEFKLLDSTKSFLYCFFLFGTKFTSWSFQFLFNVLFSWWSIKTTLTWHTPNKCFYCFLNLLTSKFIKITCFCSMALW